MEGGRRPWEIEQKLNEFLDVYSFYLRTGISLIRDEARLRAYELRLLDPSIAIAF